VSQASPPPRSVHLRWILQQLQAEAFGIREARMEHAFWMIDQTGCRTVSRIRSGFLMSRLPIAVLAAFVLPDLAAAQLPPPTWRDEQASMQVWSTTAYSARRDRAVISCINRADYDAEIMIEVAVSNASPLSSAREAQATPRGAQPSIALVSIASSEQTGNILRWSGFRRVGFETAYRLAEGLDSSGVLHVVSPSGASDTFGGESVMAKPSDTVLRCAPSVVSLRARLVRMRDPSSLITLYSDANSRCRGGSGDGQDTWVSCAERTEIEERLGRVGQCYGREGQIGADMRWHRCGQGSLRP